MTTFDFSPKMMQDPEAPIQRYPVKIIFQEKTCGYYLFGKTNEFEIYFDVKTDNQPSPHFLCLAQTFHHENECRQWLCDYTEGLTKGQELNYTDSSVELRKNLEPDASTPYIW